MGQRLLARGRRISTAALLWSAAITLGVADLLAADVLAGPRDTYRSVALVLACAAGVLLGVALMRGIGSLVAWFRIRRALRPRARSAATSAADALITAEAQRGITEIEAFLAAQRHRRGA